MLSARASSTHVATAVPHWMETSLPAGRPVPLIVSGLPARPWSGVTLRRPMLGASVEGAAIGPGRAATPGMSVGIGTGAEAARATAGMTAAASAVIPKKISRLGVLVLIWCAPFL